ncbi:hypothetical protein QJS66_04030 [Kocuria rhizophila]|nr:hypothetical protein QJS66_04030 [Kocuria rhizophila]
MDRSTGGRRDLPADCRRPGLGTGVDRASGSGRERRSSTAGGG